jgi:c(7)-type cytochrome triheme protein
MVTRLRGLQGNRNYWYLFILKSPLIISFLFSIAACRTPPDLKEEPKTEVINKEGFGSIPFYETGSLAFSAEEAKARMEVRLRREREELDKKKDEFQAQAKDRFTGDFWIPPPKDPPLVAALREFPKDFFGYPDWTLAIKRGIINPLDAIKGERVKKDEEEFNRDIIFQINDRMMANVRFPHTIHNYWFSCKVCHPGIFIPKKGANDFGMTDIWNGKYCGRCHGKIAFAPKGFENCIRCHSVRRDRVGF